MEDSHFTKGMEVEVCRDDESFNSAWYAAKIHRLNLKNKKIYVEYQSLKENKKGSKPLKEFVESNNVRPQPPREADHSFVLSDEVDAFRNYGWWEGVVKKVLKNSKYSVCFKRTKEVSNFGKSELRLHREWVDGSWVPLTEKKQKQKQKSTSSELETDQNKKVSELQLKFSKGTLVEVNSDEEGFLGAWFTAKFIEAVGEDKFLVEYQTFKTDDGTELLKEVVDALHIRPSPPDTPVDSFKVLNEVDALHNDCWWVGVISRILRGSRYMVYFRESVEELEFDQCNLRLHHDWIDGKWVRPGFEDV